MRASATRPTGVERTFGVDEVIVSKTDLKGRITYANPTFLRVSGYTEAELMGQPHSVIRHPDMPRAVFAYMWQRIAAGHELFAWVNNLAADGSHYWVFAHVTPSFGPNGRIIGYHSNRRRPDKAHVAVVSGLYDQILASERRQTKGNDAVAAGTAVLTAALTDRGLSYDEFVWDLIAGQKVGA